MKLSDNKKLAITAVSLIGIFAIGYRVGVSHSDKTTDVTKVVTDKTTVKKKTKTKVIKAPDGTETTETEVSDTVTDTKRTKDSTVVKEAGAKTHINALVGVDVTNGPIAPIYGVAVSRDLVGPISVGAFGLTNGVVGASVGISF